MYYEINVAFLGRHLFATAKRSLTTKEQMEICVKLFKSKFPESEGYHISVVFYENTGLILDISNL